MFLSRWRKPAEPQEGPRRLPEPEREGLPDGDPSPHVEADIVTQAAVEGLYRASEPRRRPTAQELEQARLTAERGRLPGELERAIEFLLPLVTRYPEVERFQIHVARVLEAHKDRRAAAVWQGIDHRFAKSPEAFRLVLRWTARDFGRERAQALFNQRYPQQPAEPDDLILYARACEELRNHVEADEAYAQLDKAEGVTAVHLVNAASAVRRRGEIWRAADLVEAARARFGDTPRLKALADEIDQDVAKIGTIVPGIDIRKARVGNVVLEAVMADLAAKRNATLDQDQTFVGSVAMISGSLGCGGAERQFTNTALALKARIEQGAPVAGYDVHGPIHAVCRSLKSRADGDFFLKDLQAQDIPVQEYSEFPEYGGNAAHSVARDLMQVLRYIPAPIAESVRKLADVLAAMRPDVVHIWQDGSILATGIAALLADVPRIVLSVRSVPPVDRPERHRHEYEVVFRSLLAARGVSLMANSQAIARRYADWLGIDLHRIDIVRNGWAAPETAPDEPSFRLFREFEARTPDSKFTVGAVFRFDENKRPFLWLDAAAQVLGQSPGARFIMVGDGPLLHAAKQYAARLGIADRVLFTGRSSVVGFWLSKLDVFLLLSRFEGLPNVLIEAQFAGVPVVTTDAGGSSETIVPGETGTVLANAAAPAAVDIAAAVLSWRSGEAGRAKVAAAARRSAAATFSIDAMVTKTVQAYMRRC